MNRHLPYRTLASARRVTAILVSSLAWVGCLSPPGGEPLAGAGELEDFGRMLEEAGLKPVEGRLSDAAIEDDGVNDPLPIPDLEGIDPDLVVPEPVPEPFDDPYIRFGERILVKDGPEKTEFITKPYPLPPGKPQKILELMRALEPFPYREKPKPNAEGITPALDASMVEYTVLEKWDSEYYRDFRNAAAAPNAVELSDLLIITAVPELLGRFEDFLNLFAVGVPQIELEAKIIEIVDTDTFDFGVRPIGPGTPIFGFGDSNFVRAFDFNLANTTSPTEALLTIGALQDGVAFNSILEAVQSWQNVSIESRPKTVVRAGGIATLDSTVEIPFFEIKTVAVDGSFSAATSFRKVGIKLSISPRIVGSSNLALEVQLEGSQVVGSQATFSTPGGPTIEVPTIASRTAKTLVHMEPGQTLLIGGLTQERTQEIVNKVPLLGDIPIIRHLFRSRFEQVERETVLFAISPRIVQSSEFEQDL